MGQAGGIWQGLSQCVLGGSVFSPWTALQNRLARGQLAVGGASLAVTGIQREVSGGPVIRLTGTAEKLLGVCVQVYQEGGFSEGPGDALSGWPSHCSHRPGHSWPCGGERDGGAPEHTLTELSLMDLPRGQAACSPPSSTLGVTGPIGELPLEPSTAPSNWLPSLRWWARWYFLVVGMRAPLWAHLSSDT